jgi:hypothetical protein
MLLGKRIQRSNLKRSDVYRHQDVTSGVQKVLAYSVLLLHAEVWECCELDSNKREKISYSDLK